MAYLNLQAIEPVNFGGKECTPKIDAETKLRLSQIKEYNEKDCKVLASAFPDDEDYVLEFLGKMATIDIQTLHAYLIGGPTMVESMLKSVDRELENAIGGKK